VLGIKQLTISFTLYKSTDFEAAGMAKHQWCNRIAVKGVTAKSKHVQQECEYLDLNSLLECNVQRFILLLQLILGVQRIVSAFPNSNINTG